MASPSAARKQLVATKKKKDDEQNEERLPAFAVLSIDATDNRGRRWVGQFHFTVPTIGDQVEIGKVKAILAANHNLLAVDQMAAGIVAMMSYLEVTIDHSKAPAWWNECDHGAKLYDGTPLAALYAEARAYEERFHGTAQRQGSDREGDGEAGDGGGDGAVRGDAVVADVQPPAKRREVIASHDR